jgi:hypothetical protein
MEPTQSTRPPNEFELAADAYISNCPEFKAFESALRAAFYAGCQYGLNTAHEVHRQHQPTPASNQP